MSDCNSFSWGSTNCLSRWPWLEFHSFEWLCHSMHQTFAFSCSQDISWTFLVDSLLLEETAIWWTSNSFFANGWNAVLYKWTQFKFSYSNSVILKHDQQSLLLPLVSVIICENWCVLKTCGVGTEEALESGNKKVSIYNELFQ